MVNGQRIDPNRINKSDREILSKYREQGFIDGEDGYAVCITLLAILINMNKDKTGDSDD